MYTVKSGEQYAKITITDAETVKFSDKWDVFGVKGDDITVKLNSTDTGDGVYNTDDTGGAVIIAHGRRLDTMYLTGTGDVIVWAGASAVDCPFPKIVKGGGSGGDNTHYKGTTTTPISNGSTANPIVINEESYTAVFGDIVVYNYTEFVFDGTQWSEIGRPFDTTPTSGSANAVTSDGIYRATPMARGGTGTSAVGTSSSVGNSGYSFAFGSSASATANFSTAIGNGAASTQAYCTAIGRGVWASKSSQSAFGKFNSPQNNTIFEVGCGSDSNHRANILEATTTSVNVNGDVQRDGVGIDDYTTTERKIGKWIDGSDLYQRTFEVTGLLNDNQWHTNPLGTSGIDIVDFSGYVDFSSDDSFADRQPLNMWIANDNHINVDSIKSDLEYRINRPDLTVEQAVITIKYTKPSVQSNLMQTAPTEEVSETPTAEEDDMR